MPRNAIQNRWRHQNMCVKDQPSHSPHASKMKGDSTTQALALTCQVQSCARNNRTKVVAGHRNSNKTMGVVRPWLPNVQKSCPMSLQKTAHDFFGGRNG